MNKRDNLIKSMIDKMLEKHGVDMEHVKEHEEIEGQPWYRYYTWTSEESESHRKWAVKEIKSALRCTKFSAEKEYAWFNLMYGLKITK